MKLISTFEYVQPFHNGNNIFNKLFQAVNAVKHSLIYSFCQKIGKKLATFALFGINGCKLTELR